LVKHQSIGETNSNGEFRIFNKNEFDAFCKNNPNKRFVIKLEQTSTDKTSNQLKYYWGVIVPRCQEQFEYYGSKYSRQETHEQLKTVSPELTNSETTSIKELSVTQMKNYIDDVIRWAAENLEIEIPEAK